MIASDHCNTHNNNIDLIDDLDYHIIGYCKTGSGQSTGLPANYKYPSC